MGCNVNSTISLKTISQLAGIKLAIDAFKEIIDLTASFEGQMAKVQAVSQAGGAELEKLSLRARELGKDTIFTATEAGKGMEELARLGFTVKENYQAIESTLTLAASSALGLARASEIVAGGLRSFGEAASQASRLADILAITAARSGADVNSWGESMKHAGAIAKTAGVTLEEFSAVIGAMGDRMIKGDQAGTGFRQLITGISTQAPKGARALKELGLTYADLDVSTKGLIPVLELLKNRFDLVEGSQQRLQLAADIWGRRQFNAALVALDSVDKIKLLVKEYDRGAGASKRMADIMINNLEGSFKRFKSVSQETALTLGKEVSPAMKFVIDDLIKMQNEALKTGDTLETIGKVLATIVIGFDVLVSSLRIVKNGIQVVFGEIIVAVQEFERDFSNNLAELAKAGGLDDVAKSLKEHADEIDVALKKNQKNLDDARTRLGESALSFEDGWNEWIKIWKDAPEKVSEVDDQPIYDYIERITTGIKLRLNRSAGDVTVSSKVLIDALNIAKSIDTSKLNDESKSAVESYINNFTKTTQQALQSGENRINISIDSLREILSFSKLATGIDPRISDNVRKLTKEIKSAIDDGQVDIKLSAERLTDILKLGQLANSIDVDKMSKEAKDKLAIYVENLISLLEVSGQEINPAIVKLAKRLRGIGDSVKEGADETNKNIPDLDNALDKIVTSIDTSIGKVEVKSGDLKKKLSEILGFDKEQILKDAAALEAVLQSIKIDGIQLDPEQKKRLDEDVKGMIKSLERIKENAPPLLAEAGRALGLYVMQFDTVSGAAGSAADSVDQATKRMADSVKSSSDKASGVKGYQEFASNTEQAIGKTVHVIKTLDEATGKTSTVITDFNIRTRTSNEDLKKAYEELGDKAKESSEKQADSAGGISQAAGAVDNVSESAKKAKDNIGGAADASERMAASATTLESGLNASVSVLENISTKAGDASGVLDKLSKPRDISINLAPLIEANKLLDQALEKKRQLTDEASTL